MADRRGCPGPRKIFIARPINQCMSSPPPVILCPVPARESSSCRQQNTESYQQPVINVPPYPRSNCCPNQNDQDPCPQQQCPPPQCPQRQPSTCCAQSNNCDNNSCPPSSSSYRNNDCYRYDDRREPPRECCCERSRSCEGFRRPRDDYCPDRRGSDRCNYGRDNYDMMMNGGNLRGECRDSNNITITIPKSWLADIVARRVGRDPFDEDCDRDRRGSLGSRRGSRARDEDEDEDGGGRRGSRSKKGKKRKGSRKDSNASDASDRSGTSDNSKDSKDSDGGSSVDDDEEDEED